MSQKYLIDAHNRRITHLRLSLTEDCNFQCIYCSPPEGKSARIPKKDYLSIDELTRLVRVCTSLGITKIKLTGGEPLLRRDIIPIIQAIQKLSSIHDLSLTTNGYLLKSYLPQLQDAGIRRINVSLDSLSKDTFFRMTKRNSLERVRQSIDKALELGFVIKINVVVMKGLNDHEIPDFIQYVLKNPINEVRFIEFMPLCGSAWQKDSVFLLTPAIDQIKKEFNAKLIATDPDSVAESYVLSQGKYTGRIGFIRTISKPFCGACSRIRISAQGILRPCLFSHKGIDLKTYLGKNFSDEDIRDVIMNALKKKEEGNQFYVAKNTSHDMNPFEHLTEPNQNPSIMTIGG